MGTTDSEKYRIRQLDGKAGFQNVDHPSSVMEDCQKYPAAKYDSVNVYSARLYKTQRRTSEIRTWDDTMLRRHRRRAWRVLLSLAANKYCRVMERRPNMVDEGQE